MREKLWRHLKMKMPSIDYDYNSAYDRDDNHGDGGDGAYDLRFNIFFYIF